MKSWLFLLSLVATSSLADVRVGLLAQQENDRAFFILPERQSTWAAVQVQVDGEGTIGAYDLWGQVATDDDHSQVIPRQLYGNLYASLESQLTLGVQKRTWGFSYGFHPLSPWAENDDYGLVPSGGQAWLLWNHYGLMDSQSLLCGRNVDWIATKWQGETYCAGNWAYSGDGYDWQLVAISWGEQYRFGLAWQEAMGEAWQFWQELAWHNKAKIYHLDGANLTQETEENLSLWVLGGQWSHPVGVTLMLEFWHNGLAPTDITWQEALSQAARSPNLADLMKTPDLGQNYGLGRFNYSKDNWDISTVFVRAFADKGWLRQVSLAYQKEALKVYVAGQAFFGEAQSHWQMQPLKSQVYGGVEWHF